MFAARLAWVGKLIAAGLSPKGGALSVHLLGLFLRTRAVLRAGCALIAIRVSKAFAQSGQTLLFCIL